jgi:hypothetical protein
MKTFEIEVKEIVSKTIEIEASSIEEATLKARKLYDYEFKINEKEALINEVIEYLIHDEEKHYEVCCSDEDEKPTNHIYLKLVRLKELNK